MAPTQFLGFAALTPFTSRVLRALIAKSNSSLLPDLFAIERSAATSAGCVIPL